VTLIGQRKALAMAVKTIEPRTIFQNCQRDCRENSRYISVRFLMPAGHCIAGPAQILRQVLFHPCRRLIRHRIQMPEQLRQELNAESTLAALITDGIKALKTPSSANLIPRSVPFDWRSELQSTHRMRAPAYFPEKPCMRLTNQFVKNILCA
jgi:hypothetical protein